jgi:hypothetical protein
MGLRYPVGSADVGRGDISCIEPGKAWSGYPVLSTEYLTRLFTVNRKKGVRQIYTLQVMGISYPRQGDGCRP